MRFLLKTRCWGRWRHRRNRGRLLWWFWRSRWRRGLRYAQIAYSTFYGFEGSCNAFGGSFARLLFDALQPLGVEPPLTIVETHVDTCLPLTSTTRLLLGFALGAARLLFRFARDGIGQIGPL